MGDFFKGLLVIVVGLMGLLIYVFFSMTGRDISYSEYTNIEADTYKDLNYDFLLMKGSTKVKKKPLKDDEKDAKKPSPIKPVGF